MTIRGLHATTANFDVRDGQLCIGNKTIVEIMESAGSVPAYIYDKKMIAARVEELRSILPPAVELHYAVKANPMPAVVRFVGERVDGLDVASANELAIALESQCSPADISFAGPGKKESELQAAISAGITINVESQLELERIGRLAGSAQPRVAIRVNPDFELKSSGMRMSGGAKQFGIDAEMLPAVLNRVAELPVKFVGFHIFSGAQNLNAESICESQTKALELALDLSGHAPTPPEHINIGGGFGIPYFPGDKTLDLAPIRANLHALTTRLSESIADCKLVLELGRFIVGEAGIYVCQVIDKKVSRGQIFLVTDGGLHHHLSASGNFGQVIRKNYPVAIANRIGADTTEIASVVGPLCTPLDLLADRMELAQAEVGDYVAVFQSGAYGYSASPHGFLSHPPPAEVFL